MAEEFPPHIFKKQNMFRLIKKIYIFATLAVKAELGEGDQLQVKLVLKKKKGKKLLPGGISRIGRGNTYQNWERSCR